VKKLGFIINPISGRKSKKDIPDLIDKIIDKNKFETKIFITERSNHASEISKDLVIQGYERIVAVGGDGTMNEVAKSLLHTQTALGIIPFGSGNGLARHLNIPLDAVKALENINTDHCITIDSGLLNDHPFFCTSGVGFDAYIGHKFAENKSRGFQTYIKSTITGFIGYKPYHYKITAPFGEISSDAFLITVGNTSQYGNNAYICPFADVQDGMLDITMIKPFPKIYSLDLGRRLFSKTMDASKYSTLFKAAQIKIERDEPGPVHIDGEPMEMGHTLHFKIIPSSLKVIVPKH
jgi:YegS/Rv2252/BmrU family lipid kinase